MAEYIFVPSDAEHPTRGELELLPKHFSHDLKSDLNNIISAAEILEVDNLNSEDKARWLRVISAKAQHIDIILKALSSLGKKSNPAEFFMGDVSKALREYFGASGNLFLEERFPPEDIPCRGYFSVVYLQLFNWITNAQEGYDGAPEKKAVMEVKTIPLSAEGHPNLGKNAALYTPEEPFVRVSVSDQGYGIPAEKLPLIFQPEFTTKSHGTGLGLALTDYICDFVHGFVKVESEVGKGSKFSLYFAQERK